MGGQDKAAGVIGLGLLQHDTNKTPAVKADTDIGPGGIIASC